VPSSGFSQDLGLCSGFPKVQSCQQLNELSEMLRTLSWGRGPVVWPLLWRYLPGTRLQQVFPQSPTLGAEDKPFKHPKLHLPLNPVT